MAKKKSKKVKPQRGTGLSREGGQRRSSICKTEFPSKKKIPNSEQRNLMILLKNILRISPLERVYIIWSKNEQGLLTLICIEACTLLAFEDNDRTSLVAQRSIPCAPHTGEVALIPGWGSKI